MSELIADTVYQAWLKRLKTQFQQTQYRAVSQLNHTLLGFYWHLGEEIVKKQKSSQWGDGFLKQLSLDLVSEFPDMKGFSKRNLELIRQWYLFWKQDDQITKQLVSQIQNIPWGHNLKIISKCKSIAEASYYVENTIKHGWSRNVLVHQIESNLYHREGQAITNFEQALAPLQSDLAHQSLKDPYIFDFLSLSSDYNEHQLEQALTEHVTEFLLELGAGFAYMGKQVNLQVGERDFFIDLLFYHTQLHCYVIVELKTGDFEPEHAGKLNFYIKAVDELLKKPEDAPTIGLLLCKNKDKLVAEYALSSIGNPMGISEYKLTHKLPDSLRDALPSVESIEIGLSSERGHKDV